MGGAALVLRRAFKVSFSTPGFGLGRWFGLVAWSGLWVFVLSGAGIWGLGLVGGLGRRLGLGPGLVTFERADVEIGSSGFGWMALQGSKLRV